VAGIDHRILIEQASVVKPDVITLSRESNSAVLWECKSGMNVEVEQLNVYKTFVGTVRARDIQRVTGIQFQDPETANVQVAYCFLEEAIPRVLSFFEDDPLIPVVSLGGTTRSVSGKFQDANLDKIFRRGIKAPPVQQVPWLIVADAETTDGEFSLYLLPTVVTLIVKQAERASVTDLLSQTFLDWQCISLELRRALRDKAIRVLRNVCSAELEEHVHFCKPAERSHEHAVQIVSSLMSLEPSAQTKGLQKLQNQVASAAKRLESGSPYVPPPAAEAQTSFRFPDPG
jgi:hypothetical protein